MNDVLKQYAAIALAILLSACQAPLRDKVHLASADPFSRPLDEFNLIQLLDPGPPVDAGMKEPAETIERAFRNFYQAGGDLEQRRNSVQEAILAASDQRCGAYKAYLQSSASNWNFAFGAASTAAGAAGAIFTNADVARALAGVAGLFSGVRAEYNEDYFQNLAVYVVADAIDLRRRQIYDQIAREGQTKTVKEYPVEAAVKDAMFYHDQCSMVAGFAQASSSIKTTEDPGIDAVTRVLVKTNIIRKIADTGATDVSKAIADDTGMTATLLLGGTPLGRGGNSSVVAPTGALIEAITAVSAKASSVQDEFNAVGARFMSPDTLPMAIGAAKTKVLDALTACKNEAAKTEADIVAKTQILATATKDKVPGAGTDLRTASFAAVATTEKIRRVQNLFLNTVEAAVSPSRSLLKTLATNAKITNDVTTAAMKILGDTMYNAGCSN